MERRPRSGFALLVILTACYLAGFVGSFATNAGLAFWYLTLAKPSWSLPVWLFAPVWTLMYGLMSLAAWVIWQAEDSRPRKQFLAVFGGQLVLNAFWPWLFFGFHKVGASLGEMVALWTVVLGAIVLGWRIRASAGLMLLPYLAWLTLLFGLNLAILRMNGSN